MNSPLARARHRAPRVVDCAALTHVGLVREGNEDAHAALPDRGVLLVADGMGGHVGGEVASAIAVATARASLLARAGRQPRPQAMRVAFADAHAAILARAAREPALRGMGTTLVACSFDGPKAHVAWIGDSRAYLVRDGKLLRLTKDHGANGILYRALGAQLGAGADVRAVDLRRDDALVLMTDGACGVLDDPAMERALARGAPSCKDAARALVDRVLRAGAPDNVSVVVARVG